MLTCTHISSIKFKITLVCLSHRVRGINVRGHEIHRLGSAEGSRQPDSQQGLRARTLQFRCIDIHTYRYAYLRSNPDYFRIAVTDSASQIISSFDHFILRPIDTFC